MTSSTIALPRHLFLVVDCGGTSTRCAIFDQTATILAHGSAGSSNPSASGMQVTINSIRQAISQALQTLGRDLSPWPFTSTWIGMSGLDSLQSFPKAHATLSKALNLSNLDSDNLIVTNDCHLLASAITHPPHEHSKIGIVIIGGTGSIGMVFECSKSRAPIELDRAGGLGHLLGDDGSAWWTGRQLLRRLMDPRSPEPKPSTELLRRVWSHFGLNDSIDPLDLLEAISVDSHTESDRKNLIAELTRLVQASAYPDEARWPAHDPKPLPHSPPPDPLALSIMEEAAVELVNLIKVLVTRQEIIIEDSIIVLGGGMWASPGFVETFKTAMKRQDFNDWAGFEVVRDIVVSGGQGLIRQWASKQAVNFRR